jgi:hypothetical protein
MYGLSKETPGQENAAITPTLTSITELPSLFLGKSQFLKKSVMSGLYLGSEVKSFKLMEQTSSLSEIKILSFKKYFFSFL